MQRESRGGGGAQKEHNKQWKLWQWGEESAFQDNNVPLLYMWSWPGGHKYTIYSHPDLLELQRPNFSTIIQYSAAACQLKDID